MLKKRLIACLIIKNGIVVQSINFKKYLPIGKPSISVEFLNKWGIDEIIILDIDATAEGRGPNFEMIKNISKKCFVPLTVGGGINSLEEMKKIIRYGADKISINASAIKNASIISKASEILGDQSIVVSMDIKKNKNGKYEVYSYLDRKSTGINPVDFAEKVEKLGAGEIFLNSVDGDGSKTGFDIKLTSMVSESVSIPVIACGGAGHPQHFYDCFTKGGVNVVAAGNYFHFTEHSPITTKSFLKQKGIDVRIDTQAKYEGFSFDEFGRVAKRSEEYLDKIRFEYEAEEII